MGKKITYCKALRVSIHSLHLRREKYLTFPDYPRSFSCFNPLSSFTKREMTFKDFKRVELPSFQSTLFIYEERNVQFPHCVIVLKGVSIHSLHLRREK